MMRVVQPSVTQAMQSPTELQHGADDARPHGSGDSPHSVASHIGQHDQTTVATMRGHGGLTDLEPLQPLVAPAALLHRTHHL
ncbi:hypothetical protein GUJ93_ZPchr0010g8165 [Zizania palustris]|uniref:Uncharacterized protein n=1 Tax=Zizania palustris TaxID=103762 RepID=A0A8J5WE68_ZIZPA|nr:hypothetical protein GUJ93_ZPchr0010g8165 [Zizania palustris]